MLDVQSIVRWFLSGDNGISSESIVAHMTGCGDMLLPREKGDDTPRYFGASPLDPSDLGRCLRLLERFPEWKARMTEMAVYGPDWAGVCAQWNMLASCMADEVGIDWSKGRRAPKTYHLMKLAIAGGYRNDPNWECTFDDKGHLSSASRKCPAETAEA